MSTTIAVIGGGPAGATCAWRLARAGFRTLLYERDVAREKPCGGGLAGRAFAALPELRDLRLPWREIPRWRLLSTSPRAAELAMDPPLLVTPRRELDGALRREAVKAGAALVEQPVRELRRREGGGWLVNDHAADVVVGAGGMRCPLAKHLGLQLPRDEQAIALGRMVPGRFEPAIITRFFPRQQSYAWWFPREDHASLGIEMPGERFDTDLARKLLADFAARDLPGVDPESGEAYGWSGPAIQDWQSPRRRFAGSDWLLAGDAAGLCDVVTGEGIPYALASGRLAADAIIAGDLTQYDRRIRMELCLELARSAEMQRRFYRPWTLDLALRGLRRSPTCQGIAVELAHGTQGYLTLRKRLVVNAWKMLGEIVGGAPQPQQKGLSGPAAK